VLVAAIGAVLLLWQPIANSNATPGASGVIIGSPLLNQPAPEFELVSLDGSHVKLSDYRGRPVIVNFWASWCIPCRDEFPQFVSAKEQYSSQGLEVLGIIHEDDAQSAAAFAADHGAT